MAPHCSTCPNMAHAQRTLPWCLMCEHVTTIPSPGRFLQYMMIIYGHTLPQSLLQGFSSTCLIRPGISQDPLQSRDLIIAYHLASKHLGIPASWLGDTLGPSVSITAEQREGNQSRERTAMSPRTCFLLVCLFLLCFLNSAFEYGV